MKLQQECTKKYVINFYQEDQLIAQLVGMYTEFLN